MVVVILVTATRAITISTSAINDATSNGGGNTSNCHQRYDY